jgi:hypothetical protein
VWESDFHTDKTIINKIIKNYGEIWITTPEWSRQN